jgi:hypothetical protein
MPGLSDQGVRRGASFRRGLRAAAMALAASLPYLSQPLYLHKITHEGTYLHILVARKTMSAVTLDAFSRIRGLAPDFLIRTDVCDSARTRQALPPRPERPSLQRDFESAVAQAIVKYVCDPQSTVHSPHSRTTEDQGPKNQGPRTISPPPPPSPVPQTARLRRVHQRWSPREASDRALR